MQWLLMWPKSPLVKVCQRGPTSRQADNSRRGPHQKTFTVPDVLKIRASVRYAPPIQLIAATHALDFPEDLKYFNVILGLSLRSRATASRWTWL